MNDKISTIQRKPAWLRIRLSGSADVQDIRAQMRGRHLHTVCESALCPNIHECWGTHKTATFMILGDTCTRACRFCAVATGNPSPPDPQEPERVAAAVRDMKIRHAVITMVTRDDLPVGGASMIAATIHAIRQQAPDCTVEILVSDMNLNPVAIRCMADARPEINSHNLETVRRLTPSIRSRSDYDRSRDYLKAVKAYDRTAVTKSSLMLGLGETREEVLETMDDLRADGVDILNLGQYLQPTARHIPVVEYWPPAAFDQLRDEALQRGFAFCQAGPMVRSSYHAGAQYGHFLQAIRTARR